MKALLLFFSGMFIGIAVDQIMSGGIENERFLIAAVFGVIAVIALILTKVTEPNFRTS